MARIRFSRRSPILRVSHHLIIISFDDCRCRCVLLFNQESQVATPTGVGGARREALGWSQEKVGVLIGIDESSSRARISRYELGVHEPAVPTAKLIADALLVPLAHLYCEDDGIAALLLALHQLPAGERAKRVDQFAQVLATSAT
jgi:transcriptional regulator with XRE-family HTH domain